MRREVGGIAGARGAQRPGERAVDVMRRARLGGAGAVLVGGNEPRDDGLERVGFGGGERLQRFEPRRCERRRGHCSWRPRRGGGGGWLCGGCGLRGCGDDTRRGGGDCGGRTGEADLLEQMAARDIAGRTAPVVVVGHDVLPSVFLSCSMVHPACPVPLPQARSSREPECKPRPSPAGLTRGSIILRKTFFTKRMDCRVKPGNDSGETVGSRAPGAAHPARLVCQVAC